MSDPATTESLLGVRPAIAGSRLGLADSITAGLPVAALDRLAGIVAPDDTRFKYRLVPKATLERRVRAAKRLSVEEGDRLARLAKVFAMGLEVFRDEVLVRDFLRRPHAMLDRRAPLDVALETGPGADAVINLLGRGAYGTAV